MKYKYLAINGQEMEINDIQTKEQIIDNSTIDGIMSSLTPLVEIDGIPYWNDNTEWGMLSKEQWIKFVCPQLIKMYK